MRSSEAAHLCTPDGSEVETCSKKVLISGNNLPLDGGTGLCSYSQNLIHALRANSHLVSVLYGADQLRGSPQLSLASIIQFLRVREYKAHRKDPSSLFMLREYIVNHMRIADSCSRYMLGIRRACREYPITDGRFEEVLPVFLKEAETILNYPRVFAVADCAAIVCGHAARLRTQDTGYKPDIMHLTSPTPLRFTGTPVVTTVHDIIPLRYPGLTTSRLRRYERICQVSFRESDLILCVSQSTADDVQQWFGVPDEKIVVTYQSVDIDEKTVEANARELDAYLERNYSLSRGEYYFFPGAIDPKKNIDRFVAAHRNSDTTRPLLLAGAGGWMEEKALGAIDADARIAAIANKGGRVKSLGYLPREALLKIIQGARALVFPSLYEGFGLPVLEAMVLGTPVISSGRGGLAEVCGDACITVDPLSVESIADGINQLDKDEAACADLSARGLLQAKKFSQSKYRERLTEAYERVL